MKPTKLEAARALLTEMGWTTDIKPDASGYVIYINDPSGTTHTASGETVEAAFKDVLRNAAQSKALAPEARAAIERLGEQLSNSN